MAPRRKGHPAARSAAAPQGEEADSDPKRKRRGSASTGGARLARGHDRAGSPGTRGHTHATAGRRRHPRGLGTRTLTRLRTVPCPESHTRTAPPNGHAHAHTHTQTQETHLRSQVHTRSHTPHFTFAPTRYTSHSHIHTTPPTFLRRTYIPHTCNTRFIHAVTHFLQCLTYTVYLTLCTLYPHGPTQPHVYIHTTHTICTTLPTPSHTHKPFSRTPPNHT